MKVTKKDLLKEVERLNKEYKPQRKGLKFYVHESYGGYGIHMTSITDRNRNGKKYLNESVRSSTIPIVDGHQTAKEVIGDLHVKENSSWWNNWLKRLYKRFPRKKKG